MVSSVSIPSQSLRADAAPHARVVAAIRSASDKTGVDFSYMLRKAEQESGLNPVVKAQGSSATGLYQFVEQTWLRTIKEHGADYGLGDVASKIAIGAGGKASVNDPVAKKAILDLRNNPEISSNMAAELAKDNREKLQENVAGEIGSTELYLAHFLGSGGATQFLNKMKQNPDMAAADVLPTAAGANKSVFFDKTGQAKSLKEVYASFAHKFDDKASSGVMLADASSAPAQVGGRRDLRHVGSLGAGSSVQASARVAAHKVAQETYMMDGVVASAASVGGSLSAGRSVVPHVEMAQMSSPFATMLLAQMDFGALGGVSSFEKSQRDEVLG